MSAALLAVLAAASAAAAAPPTDAPADPLAGDHRALTRTIPFAEMEAFLKSVPRPGLAEVTVGGRSLEGRALYAVRLKRGAAPVRWRVLFYAQQHGDEVAGKDALLFMVRDVLRRPERLPEEVELWLVPSVNPDGGAVHRRQNASGADLNRDHLRLAQPETQALYRLARRVRPDLAVDCHEFGRDGEEWRARGWNKWPIIMMDGANHPLLDPALVEAGQRRVADALAPMAAAGHAYERYWVGGPPPDAEQRHSTFDANDGRNGMALHGALSFIIESGVRHAAAQPQADLGRRVDAYLVLLWRFVDQRARREADRAAVDAARRLPLPAFLPTNVLWASAGPRRTSQRVIEIMSGRVVEVPTANFMRDATVKRSVAAPRAYAVVPEAAAAYAALLERHGVAFEKLAAPRAVTAESSRLVRVEEAEDPVYARSGGRQVVERDPPARIELPTGSLLVPLDQDPPAARRAAILLEPTMLFGLFRYPEYRGLVAAEGRTPVLRVTGP